MFRSEPEPETARDHRKDPIIAIALVNHLPIGFLFTWNVIGLSGEFTQGPHDVIFLGEVRNPQSATIRQTMVLREHDHHLFPKETNVVETWIRAALRARENRNVDLRVQKLLLKSFIGSVNHLQMNLGMLDCEVGYRFNKNLGGDRAHHTKPQPRSLSCTDVVGQRFDRRRLFPDFLQVWQDDPAQFGEVDPSVLPVEEFASELLFEELHRARQGRLGYTAFPCRLREVARFVDFEKISDLMSSGAGRRVSTYVGDSPTVG